MPTGMQAHSVARACFRFHRMLPEFVWDAGVLEGNPFTFPQVQTLLDGVTVGGHKLSDQEQILNLAESCKVLMRKTKAGDFGLDKQTFCSLHALVAKNEALEWGHFRGEGKETSFTPDVALGEFGRYTPPKTAADAPELNALFLEATSALSSIDDHFERAAAFFLHGALQQYFFDGNKRTSRHMMNGVLMSAGVDAISVPAARAQEFNEKMVRFYVERDGTEMISMLASCHPDHKPQPRPASIPRPR